MIQNQAAINSAVTPTRLFRSGLRVVLAVIVLAALCVLWLPLFLLFVPLILIAELVLRIKGHTRTDEIAEIQDPVARTAPASNTPLIFDRRTDISKLYGCNTRNVRYRWRLFAERVDALRRDFKTPRALDFGAGSLRDSYELATHGFEVVAFDLNPTVLQRYYESYDWTTVGHRPALMTGSLQNLVNNLKPGSFHLIVAFDVIEHLEDPSGYVSALSMLLSERGFLFTIVPNKRSLFERYFKYSIEQQRKSGRPTEPGVPHIQFKSPEGWDNFFQENGFRIVDRDMTIGHFVNDWWNGLMSIPLRAFVYPVITVLAFRTNREVDPGKLERALCPAWLMERINSVDLLSKRWLNPRFGWNLIVAQKNSGLTS
jgi:SAM-dependent methyltransferase